MKLKEQIEHYKKWCNEHQKKINDYKSLKEYLSKGVIENE